MQGASEGSNPSDFHGTTGLLINKGISEKSDHVFVSRDELDSSL